jgi:LmbE family N-acetylglucosaminyl deacetylase
MRWIILSPHFDDAVLSCGGLIWEQTHAGLPVEIWTVCGGDAPPGPLSLLALVCHQQWGFESMDGVVAARRSENLKAATLLGAQTVDLSIPDCIYRRSPDGEFLYPQDIFAPVHPADHGLEDLIQDALAGEMKANDRLVSPMAVGGHVDHLLTRQAAEKMDCPLWYYADIPYLLNHPGTLEPAMRSLNETSFPISRKGLDAWEAGISAYRSQLPVLFETGEKMIGAISRYWEEKRGISLWEARKK